MSAVPHGPPVFLLSSDPNTLLRTPQRCLLSTAEKKHGSGHVPRSAAGSGPAAGALTTACSHRLQAGLRGPRGLSFHHAPFWFGHHQGRRGAVTGAGCAERTRLSVSLAFTHVPRQRPVAQRGARLPDPLPTSLSPSSPTPRGDLRPPHGALETVRPSAPTQAVAFMSPVLPASDLPAGVPVPPLSPCARSWASSEPSRLALHVLLPQTPFRACLLRSPCRQPDPFGPQSTGHGAGLSGCSLATAESCVFRGHISKHLSACLSLTAAPNPQTRTPSAQGLA